MQETVNQFLKFHTTIFSDCYKIWNSEKYAVIHKGSFYSELTENHSITLKEMFVFLQQFKFDVDVIQKLGAAQNDEKKMLYDEGFLNMLQRLDIEKSLKFATYDQRISRKSTFVAKGSMLHLMVIEILVKGIWADVDLKME